MWTKIFFNSFSFFLFILSLLNSLMTCFFYIFFIINVFFLFRIFYTRFFFFFFLGELLDLDLHFFKQVEYFVWGLYWFTHICLDLTQSKWTRDRKNKTNKLVEAGSSVILWWTNLGWMQCIVMKGSCIIIQKYHQLRDWAYGWSFGQLVILAY